MVKEENYNSLVSELVDSIVKDGVITKDDHIVCCTNGHSPIAFELEALGYDAVEVPVKNYDGKCDVVITKVSDTNNVSIMNVTDTRTKFITMYNRLFTGKTAEKINKYFIKNIGNSVNIHDGERIEPFDNRVFVYNFEVQNG